MCSVMEESGKSWMFKISFKPKKSYALQTKCISTDINGIYRNGKEIEAIEPDFPKVSDSAPSNKNALDCKDSKLSLNIKTLGKPMTGLDNLGNTCFLNSILYLLRFTPGFRQKLHLLANEIENKQEDQKGKLDLIPGDHLVLEMHSVFKEMYKREIKNTIDSLSPQRFLDAVRQHCLYDINSQEDAHELLVYLLDFFSHCNNSGSHNKLSNPNVFLGDSLVKNIDDCTLDTFPFYRKKKREKDKMALNRLKKRQKKDLEIDNLDSISICSSSSACSSVDYLDIDVNGMHINGTCSSFIQDLLEGKAVTRTRCLECECYTDTKQEFTNLQVSWTNLEKRFYHDEDVGEEILLQKALCETELLQDVNKYYCNYCKHYTEACRSVHYDTLPPVLILQLKMFLAESEFLMSKSSPSIPVPFVLPCFCETCLTNKGDLPHQPYQLYGVIFHIGLSIASGHYVAYVRRKVAEVDLPLSNVISAEQDFKKTRKGFAKYFSMAGKTKVLTNIQNCCSINVKASETGVDNDENEWLECDDSNVKFVSEEKVQALLKCSVSSPTTPYLLFYSHLFSC